MFENTKMARYSLNCAPTGSVALALIVFTVVGVVGVVGVGIADMCY